MSSKWVSNEGRNIQAIYLAFALQSLGQAIAWQFGTYFLQEELLVESYVLLTIIWSVPYFITMASVSSWGSFSDRRGRRKPFMLIGFMGYSFTFLMFSFVQSSIQWFIVSAIGAVFSSAAIPSGQALATTATMKKGERLGFLLVAQSSGWFVGAFSSGILYDIIGMFELYRIAAISCISATLICYFFVRDYEFDPDKIAVRPSVRVLLRRPGMKRLSLAAALSALGINSIVSMMAIMIVNELGGLAVYVGLANAGATFLAVLFTGFIGRVIDKRGPGRVLVLAYLSYIIFAIGFGLARDPVTAALLYALPIYPLSNTAAYAFAALLSRDEERGGAMGLVNGAQNAGTAVGPVIGGIFAEYIFFAVQPISWINMTFNIIACSLAVSLIPLARALQNRRLDDESKPSASNYD
ncbi:MAG: MFS transporter [Candidatus Thorarchaeota archaeon]